MSARGGIRRRGGALFYFPLVFSFLGAAPAPALAGGRVLTGLDVLERDGFAPLSGKRVGLICNHTALDAGGRHAVDLLKAAPGVTLAAVFSPEHGFSGRVEHGRGVADATVDGIPLYSLYGERKRPSPAMLAGLDALVFDVQDAGARFYTYITTMGYALEETARAGMEFIVLDRPNPTGGSVAEGEVLADDVRHFTAYYSIPARHGLTVGELARWHDARAGLKARLTVIPMEGWTRDMLWADTGLAFTAPSPNIPDAETALLYAGIGAFEATNVSVGRGTAEPFHLIGAPWVDGDALLKRLSAAWLPGVAMERARFRPERDRHAGEPCEGVRLRVTDPRRVRPVAVFAHAACALRDMRPDAFQPRWAEMPHVVGSREFEALFRGGASAEKILRRWGRSVRRFMRERRPFLLY